MDLSKRLSGLTGGGTTSAPSLSDFNELFGSTGLSNPLSAIDPTDYKLNRRGKMMYQHDLSAAQYAAELQLMMYQNAYNSPTAQAQRQREAGINPDLAGVSGESAAGMQGNVSTPDASGIKTNFEQVLGIVDTTMSIFGAMSSGIFGVASGINALQGQKLGNLQKALGMVGPVGGMVADLSPIRGDSTKGFDSLAHVDSFLSGIPRKYRGVVGQYLTEFVGSRPYQSRQFQGGADLNKSRGAFASSEVDPTLSGDLEDLMAALKPIQEAEFRIAKQLLSSRESEAEQRASYWSRRDLGAQADSENSQDAAAKGEADIQEIIRSGALKTVGYLEKEMQNGKWWASTALAALYASISGAMKTPSLGLSSSSKTSPNGETFENSAWSFGF